MFSRAAVLFRVIAVAEALSWAALLVAMFFKHILGFTDGGVPIAGMVHGVLFVAYITVTLATFRLLRWNGTTVVLALAAGIPPLCTWWFEVWALRSGKLDDPRRRPGGLALLTVDRPTTSVPA